MIFWQLHVCHDVTDMFCVCTNFCDPFFLFCCSILKKIWLQISRTRLVIVTSCLCMVILHKCSLPQGGLNYKTGVHFKTVVSGYDYNTFMTVNFLSVFILVCSIISATLVLQSVSLLCKFRALSVVIVYCLKLC